MIVIEDRRYGRHNMKAIPEEMRNERFEVESADSSLTFFATSTLFPVYGKVSELNGYVEAVWNSSGALVVNPLPRMHLEAQSGEPPHRQRPPGSRDVEAHRQQTLS